MTVDFDAAEWEPLIRRQVRGYCRAPLPAHTSQDDLVQETLLAVWRSLPDYPGTRDDLPKWITTIARHRVLDAYRAAARRPTNPTDDVDDVVTTASDEVEAAATLALDLNVLLARVSPAYREVLARLALGQSNQQVAAAVGRSVTAIKVSAHRGRRQLRGEPPYPARRSTDPVRRTRHVDVSDIRWPDEYLDRDLGDLSFLVGQLRAGRPIPPVVLRLARAVRTVADWPSARRLAAAHLANVTRVRAVWAPLPVFPLATVDLTWRPSRTTS